MKYDTSPAQGRHGHRRGVREEQHGARGTPTHTLYFTGGHALKASKAAATAGVGVLRQRLGRAHVVLRDLGARGQPGQQRAAPTPPGTFVSFTSDPLAAPADVVGSPKVTLQLSTPTAGYTQMGGPSGQLVLFAKIYDIAPDGSKVLKNRMVAPLRVADTNKLVTLRLPGHRAPVRDGSPHPGGGRGQRRGVRRQHAAPARSRS